MTVLPTLSEMNHHDVAELVDAWAANARRLLKSCAPGVMCLEKAEDGEADEICSSVPFVLYRPDRYGRIKPLSFDETNALWTNMIQGDDRVLFAPPQVLSADTATLRLTLETDTVLRCLADKDEGGAVLGVAGRALRLAAALTEDARVVAKLRGLCFRCWPQSRFYGDLLLHPAPATKRLRVRMDELDRQLLEPRDKCNNLPLAHRTATASATRFSAAAEELLKMLAARNIQGALKNAVLYDWDVVQANTATLKAAFPPNSRHCFAAKAAPIPYLVHHFVQAGCGVEAASVTEMRLALRLCCPPEKIVFDSPCKTYEEVREALLCGVTLNANTFNEVKKIKEALEELAAEGIASKSWTGLRINPLVGGGAIAELSTATISSKFGIPLTDLTRPQIMECFRTNCFLNGLMLHVGSTGMSVDTMTEGIAVVNDLANEVDAIFGGEARIQYIDIGGGLHANTDSDELSVSFDGYVEAIKTRCPDFLLHPDRTIVTEFGKALVLKAACVVSRVEDKLDAPPDPQLPVTAIVHAGADLFMRPAYVPSMQEHRIELLNAQGQLVPKPANSCSRPVTIAGPLCHSTDFLAKGRTDLAEPRVGDFMLLLDCGGNTLSTFGKHCSR